MYWVGFNSFCQLLASINLWVCNSHMMCDSRGHAAGGKNRAPGVMRMQAIMMISGQNNGLWDSPEVAEMHGFQCNVMMEDIGQAEVGMGWRLKIQIRAQISNPTTVTQAGLTYSVQFFTATRILAFRVQEPISSFLPCFLLSYQNTISAARECRQVGALLPAYFFHMWVI